MAKLVLGIETTCDETAAAVVADGVHVRSNVVWTQVALHQKFGGVVPEIASRAHLEHLDQVIKLALTEAGVTPGELGGVAVSNCPGLIGCLIVGVSAAKALAMAWNLPLLAVNHVHAHLYASLLAPADTPLPVAPTFPAIGLTISGGHTALYLVRSFEDIQRIGATHDDAVGEAFDKVAAIMELGYPGGPIIDRIAQQGDPKAVRFPVPLLEPDSLNFSFSGLKTAVLYHARGHQGKARPASDLSAQDQANIAVSFQNSVAKVLSEKIRRAVNRYHARSIIIGGGVSANRSIRQAITTLGTRLAIPVHIPAMPYCTDNAAMIAGLGYHHWCAGITADLALEAIATVG